MGIIKAIFANRHSRIWFIVTVSMVTLLTVLSILMTTVFYSLIAILWGDMRRITGDGDGTGEKIYTADFATKNEARLNAESVNEDICEEGFVLLKNENNVLPLETSAQGKKRISVFGKNSVNLVHGATGSGGGSGEYHKSIYNSLEAANYEYNNTLKLFYENNDPVTGSGPARPTQGLDDQDKVPDTEAYATRETPQTLYTADIRSSYAAHNDAAVIVITRVGGESRDLPRVMGNTVGAADPNDHYLQLDKNETDLITAVTASFDKVILVINSATTMELGAVKDNPFVDACIWVGAPGDTGIMALGAILNGKVNPSGRTVDTWARDFKKDPTWQNFASTHGGGRYIGSTGDSARIGAYVDYEEGIYMGYRYYETRGAAEGGTWYGDNVVYPFGYGMSYASFTQSIANKPASAVAVTAAGKISVKVNVSNTHPTRAGKDAVQIYVTQPYAQNGSTLEKSHVVLAGFAKTPEIPAGGTETVTIDINPYDFASWDSNLTHADGTTKGGYVLEAGNYEIKLMKNSHELIDSFTANVASTIKYEKDPVTSEVIKNRFDDADDELVQKLSRSNFAGTFPAPRTNAEKALREEVKARIVSSETNNTFSTTEMPIQGAAITLTFSDMVGKPYIHDDWDKLIDQITTDQMIDLVSNGAFKTALIESIGKPLTIDADGPAGFANFMAGSATTPIYEVSHYACEPIMAATFSEKLLYKYGEAVGNEALVGNARGDKTPYSGWYAPGMNLHRSPFGGRAGEYYSEDPFLSGMLGSSVIQGAKSKGVYTQVKHFAVNEQETDRIGVCTWLTEQTLREIYLKPFELAVKEGKSTGMMSSFNRIGAMWTGGDYRLLTDVLRTEWGFQGMVICDFNTGAHMNARQMHYAGGDLNLQSGLQAWSPRKSNATDIAILRKCSKNILYTVANSNAMNDEIIGYMPPIWVIILIVVDSVALVGFAVWGFFAVRGALKKKKASS